MKRGGAKRSDIIVRNGMACPLSEVLFASLPPTSSARTLFSHLPLCPAKRLVDHDPRVGQRLTLPLRPRPQQERAHRRCHAEANRLDVAWDELHGVVDGEAGGDGAAGGVYVQGDVLVGIVLGQVQQLGDEHVGDLPRDGGWGESGMGGGEGE